MGDKVIIEALDMENYGTWCIWMKTLLIHKKLWKGVEDPSANSDESQSALAYITLYVTLDEIRCSSARRVRKPRLAFQQT
jgi:hypothetical protein